jgi:hypothetical protein
MDIQAFDDARKTDLQNFQTKYASLKQRYSVAISAAIQEQDASSQSKLVQTVLDLNVAMTSAITDIIKKLNEGTGEIDTVTLDKLTNDLNQYRQEYVNLKKSMDILRTLKMIEGTTSSRLAKAIATYNIYLSVLFILCLIVVTLAIRAAWTTSLPQRIVNTVTQTGGRR